MRTGAGSSRAAMVLIVLVVVVIAGIGTALALAGLSHSANTTTTSNTTAATSIYQSSSSLPTGTNSGSATATSQTTSSSSASSSQSSSASVSSSGAVSATSIDLYAGSSTNATSQGTAAMFFVLENSGPSTTISSLTIASSVLQPPVVYQCPSLNSCAAITSAVVNGNSNTYFTTPTTGFFFGANLVENQSYNYTITLANAQTISGVATATSKLIKDTPSGVVTLTVVDECLSCSNQP